MSWRIKDHDFVLGCKTRSFFFAATSKEKNVACVLMYPFFALRGVIPTKYETKLFASCRAYKEGKKRQYQGMKVQFVTYCQIIFNESK